MQTNLPPMPKVLSTTRVSDLNGGSGLETLRVQGERHSTNALAPVSRYAVFARWWRDS